MLQSQHVETGQALAAGGSGVGRAWAGLQPWWQLALFSAQVLGSFATGRWPTGNEKFFFVVFFFFFFVFFFCSFLFFFFFFGFCVVRGWPIG